MCVLEWTFLNASLASSYSGFYRIWIDQAVSRHEKAYKAML